MTSIPRQLYRQVLRNARRLGWEHSRGVPLSLMDTGDRPLKQLVGVKYYWNLEWGKGFTQGWVWRDMKKPALHSLVYEVKNGILYNDKSYLDLLFRIVKQTGDWAAEYGELENRIGPDIKYRADPATLASQKIVYTPFELDDDDDIEF